MNENSYYISIKSTSLAHYIGKALILPSRFYKNRPTDIQTIESDYIILSKEKFLNDSNCSIEIILNEQERENLEQNDNNLFFYKNSIPISRIKKIFFINEEQKILTISKINRDLGFISEKSIEIVDKQSEEVNVEFNNYKYSSELEEKIKTYNHILGGLSFVRYGLDGNYSENYFSILSYFNKLIENELKKIEGYKIVDGYAGAFTGKGAWSELYPLLFENINENDVLNFSKKEKIKIKNLDGLWQYEEIENKSITYKLAILNNYGEDSTKRRKTKALIYDFEKMKIPKDKQEGISLIYGINNGYSAFYNSYDKKIVKFKMDSLLDYYTIESVFQYVINDKKDNEIFQYIDYIGIEKDIVLNKEYETYTVLDEMILSDRKTIVFRIQDWINERLFRELDTYINNLFEKIRNLMSEKKELNKNNTQLSQQLNKKEQEIKDKVIELNSVQTKYNTEIQKLKNDGTRLAQQLNDKQKEIENKSYELKNIQNKYNNETQKNQELNIKLEEININNTQLSQQLNKKEQEIEDKVNKLNNVQINYNTEIQNNQSLKNEVEELKTLKIQLMQQLDYKNKEFINKSNDLNIIQDKYNNETQKLNNQIEELENKNSGIEAFDEEKERIIIEKELNKWRMDDLKNLAKEHGLKFKSKIKRDELIDILKKNKRLL